MSASSDGGPAFPVLPPCNMEGASAAGYPYPSDGMTLRDYFAAAAMQGFCADHTRDQVENMRTLAGYAYEMADAMLKARTK